MGDYRKRDVQNIIGLVHPSYVDRVVECASRESGKYDEIHLYSDDELIRKFYQERADFKFFIGGDEIEALRALINSKHLCISNSTFSLMAMYLSSSLEVIYRPTFWAKSNFFDELTDELDFVDVRYVDNRFIDVDDPSAKVRLHGGAAGTL